MGNLIDVGVKVDDKVITGAVQEIVMAGIVAALGDPTRLLKDAVGSIIKQRLDSDGKPSTSSYSTTTYLDWLAKKTVQETVTACMTRMVSERRELFESEVERQLSDPNFRAGMVSAFVTAVLQSSQSSWRMPIFVSFEPTKND